MGNNNGKESRTSGDRRSGESATRSPPSSGFSFGLNSGSGDGSSRLYSSRDGRSSRNNLGIFGSSGPSEREADPHGPRRETRQEREARKLEKERRNRALEREQSMKEEHVDGGYLVTLGTYVGVEDFSKPTVRKLQVCLLPIPFVLQKSLTMRSSWSAVWLLSGEVSTTIPDHGPSISLSLPPVVSLFQLPMRFPCRRILPFPRLPAIRCLFHLPTEVASLLRPVQRPLILLYLAH